MTGVLDRASKASELYEGFALGRPPRRPAEISRDDVLAKYPASVDRKVVLISAPAGYGKTIVAAQWCDTEPTRPSVWIGLSDSDNDPIAFLMRLTAALHALRGDVGGDDPGSAETDHDSGVRRVARMAGQLPAFVLVLDDLHNVTNSRSLGLVTSLIDAAPVGAQIVLARRDPDIGLARRRANGELLEIRSDALAMDLDETTRYLDAAEVGPSRVGVTELHDRTEGWPAGIGLAALAHDRRSTSSHLADFSGEQREIADYLFDEVLARQDPLVREFLLASSVVSRFSAPMCDAMLDRTDSASAIRELEQTNLFLVALDTRRGWYRYHHLFQEMLVAELDRTDPSARAKILRPAAAWHDEHGTIEEALRYAQASGDLALAGRLLLTNWRTFSGRGQIETLRMWVERSTEEDIASDAALAIGSGWVFSMLGDVDRAERCAAAAAVLPLDGPSPDGATSLECALANFRSGLGTGGPRQMLEDGLFVVAAERPVRSPLLVGGLRAVGTAELLLGHVDESIAALDEVRLLTAHSDQLRAVRMFNLGYLALAHLDNGEVRVAQTLVAQTDGLIADLGGELSLQTLPGMVAKAAVLERSNDRDGATSVVLAVAGTLGLAGALPWMLADLALRSAETAIEVGQTAVAETLLGTALSALRRLPETGRLSDRYDQLSRRASSITPLLETLTPAERRVLPQLATHRTLVEIGERLFISRATVKTHVKSIYAKLGVSTRTEAVEAFQGTPPDRPDRPR